MTLGEAFAEWSDRWMRLAQHSGRELVDAPSRIDSVLALFDEPVPDGWKRGPDARLLDPQRRYTRSNGGPATRRTGEHALEYELLGPSPAVRVTNCLGQPLIDGINAVPLTKDAAGGRRGNVEADMLLLTASTQDHRLLLVEVKVTSDNAWYAVVENLRQLRLFRLSTETRRIFHARNTDLHLPSALPIHGVVLAPQSFYHAPGKKSRSIAPAQELLRRAREAFDANATLAVWDADHRTIATFNG